MEQDNVKENEINKDVEKEEDLNLEENKELINSVEKTDSDESEYLEYEETYEEETTSKNILANILDQLLVVACSSLLVIVCDLVLKIFGYMFVKDNGAVILAGGIIYFIINCVYGPIMERTKLKGTFAKKILSI